MRFAFYAAVLSSVILSATGANAATYYVALSGNDANAGTLAAPLRTVTKAAGLAKPGDVVEVRGGTYNEAITIGSKGTATAPIIFRNYGTERPIYDGSALAADKAVVTLYATEYVEFRGFEIRNASYIGVSIWKAKSTKVAGNEIHRSVRNGIFAGTDIFGTSTDVTISGNLVHDNVLENQAHTTTGGWAGAVAVSKIDRATITGNKIWNNDGEGIIANRSDRVTIDNNETFDNYSVNIYLDNARYTAVNANLIYSTGNTRYYRSGYPAAGIMVANETYSTLNPSTDNTIANNIVVATRWGFYYGSFESGGGLKNTTVANNTFYGTHQDILHIDTDAHANSVVKNNIFVQTNGTSAAKTAGAGVSIRRNLWHGGSAGTAAGLGDVIGDPLFVNAGGLRAEDYKLQALSLALHAAEDDTVVQTDYFGAARTASYDLGAHELSLSLGSSAPAVAQLPAPTGVRAEALTSSVRLTWTAPEGVAAYNVYRNGTFVGSVQNPSFTDGNVAAGNTYSYEVTSTDGVAAESVRSAAVAVSIAAAPVADTENPTRPGTPRLVLATSTAVSISWTASSDNVGVTSYDIYRNGVRIASTELTGYTDNSVAANTSYEYAIVARDAAGNASPRSSSLTVATPKPTSRTRTVR